MAHETPDVDEKRSEMVSIRLTKEQAEILRREAEEAGETVSQLVRRVLVGGLGGDAMNLYATSTTTVGSGFAFEFQVGQLVPITSSPYVSELVPG